MFEKFTIIVSEYGSLIIDGVFVTLFLSLIGTLIGFIIAIFLGSVTSFSISTRTSLLNKIIKKLIDIITKIYVTVIRGTPMIVQAMIFYYGFFQIGIKWSPLQAGLFTVSINTGAYLTDVVKNGITSIDIGQSEAARSLGMSKFKTMFYIILPQAIKTQMASIGNEFIINIKDTAVLNVIWVVDLYAVAKTAASQYYWYLEAMLVAAIIYLILTYATSIILKQFEKRLGIQVKEIVSSN